MESFGTSLLRLKRLTDTAMLVAVVMQQLANGNRVVEATPDEIREATNRLFGRRISLADIKRAQEELVEAGVLLGENHVRPLDAMESSSLSRAEAEQRFHSQIHDDGSNAAPDREFSELHTRFYGALLAVNMAPAMMKLTRSDLRDEQGEIVLVEGRRKQVNQLVWDYAHASKLIKQYDINHIVDTCLRVWPTIRRNNPQPPVLDADHPDTKERLQRFRAYFIAALGQRIEPEAEDEPLVLRN